jgi:hypothetical protein
MNEFKPILRLIVTVQIFLLFFAIILPAIIRGMQEPMGKFVYGILAVLCIVQALLLRRALSHLE